MHQGGAKPILGIDPSILILGLVPLLVFVIMASWVGTLYQKCGPNQAMIITGLYAAQDGRPFKIVVSGGAIVLPLVQQRSFLSLEVLPVLLKSQVPILTTDGSPVRMEAIAQIRVPGEIPALALAAETIMGKNAEEVKALASEIMLANIRAVASKMTLAELQAYQHQCAKEAKDLSVADLSKLGLTVLDLRIKEILV